MKTQRLILLEAAEEALSFESHEEISLFAQRPGLAAEGWGDLADLFVAWALAEKTADESFDRKESGPFLTEEEADASEAEHHSHCEAGDHAWCLCQKRILQLTAEEENKQP